MSESKNINAGYINVLELTITNHNGRSVIVTDPVIYIELYESIFENTMSGTIAIEDAAGLMNSLPLIGEETLYLKYTVGTSITEVEKEFYIYKMSNRTFEKMRKQSYLLHFVSKERIISENIKTSKSYSGSISETVVSIYNNAFTRKRNQADNKILFIDDTKNSLTFISPFWSPLQTINWLCRRAINTNNAANFLFFETNQSFEFVSMDHLMNTPSAMEYIYSDIDAASAYGSDTTVEFKSKFVQKLYADVGFDYLRRLKTGMYSGNLYTLDIIFKNVNKIEYNYADSFPKTNHLDKHPLNTASVLSTGDANLNHIIKNSYRFDAIDNQNHDKWFLQNQSLMEQLSAYKLILEVPGNSKIKAGSVIDFILPTYDSFGKTQKTELKDSMYSGKYLVTSIKHSIIVNQHTMYVEIVKDSIIKQIIDVENT